MAWHEVSIWPAAFVSWFPLFHGSEAQLHTTAPCLLQEILDRIQSKNQNQNPNSN